MGQGFFDSILTLKLMTRTKNTKSTQNIKMKSSKNLEFSDTNKQYK